MAKDALVIENAQLIFTNFSGAATQYNREGDRNFCVIIDDPELANKMNDDGWNVKVLRPRDVEDEPKHYLKVNVSYRGHVPPKVVLISGKNKIPLDETDISRLDRVAIKSADLAINPYHWTRPGSSGISAYLKTLYVEQDIDEFESKYADDYREVDDSKDLPF